MEKEEITQENQDLEKDDSIQVSDDVVEDKKKETSLEDKNKNLEEKITRLYAEMENQRRRYEKEKDDAFEYGGFAFSKEALSLLDNLERSKMALENDEKIKDKEILKIITSHLEIIYDDMISIFKKNNIKPIKSINEKLDPNLHQAMMEIIDDSKEAGTIIQEIQKGFTIKDRLLRPSLVGVSKKSQVKDKKKENMVEKSK